MEELAQKTVIISNLPDNFNENELQTQFSAVGEIEEFLKINESQVMITFKEKDSIESSMFFNQEDFYGKSLELNQPTPEGLAKIKEQNQEKPESKKEESAEFIQNAEQQAGEIKLEQAQNFIPDIIQKPVEEAAKVIEEVKEKVEKVVEEAKEKVQEKIVAPIVKTQDIQMEIMSKLQNINVPVKKPLKSDDYFQHVIQPNYILGNFLVWFVFWWALFK